MAALTIMLLSPPAMLIRHGVERDKAHDEEGGEQIQVRGAAGSSAPPPPGEAGRFRIRRIIGRASYGSHKAFSSK